MTIIPFKTKLHSDVKQLEWIDSTKVDDYYKNDISSLYAFRKIIPTFFKMYPTPLHWINDDEKHLPKYNYGDSSNTTNPLIYILFWIYETNVLEIKEYEPIILNYLASKFKSSYLENFALYKNLISKKDIEKIKDVNKSARLPLAAICLPCICYKKKFKDITDEDLEKFYRYNIIHKFAMQNLRIKLGLSNIIPKPNSKKRRWEALYNDEKFGDIFKKYIKFLKSSHTSSNKSTTSRYLSTTGTVLGHLLDFINESNYEDFSAFESPSVYEDFIEYLEQFISPQSVKGYIPRARNFIDLHLGEEFFPKRSNFCDNYWSMYSRNLKKLYRESEGLSFSDPRLAKEIVLTLLNYEPENDIEFLCKQFWLIIATTTARFNYILSLDAYDAMRPLPNSPKEAYGVYSKFADKAGNRYGQFPILDKLGTTAIKNLQDRVKELNLKPVYDKDKKCSYVHLFQLKEAPWILSKDKIHKFFHNNILTQIKGLETFNSSNEEIRASAHSYRHYLATHITLVAKDIEVTQTALGHLDSAMSERYVTTKSSKETILIKMVDSFQKKEITGKFYLRVVEALTSENTTDDELISIITTEMKLDDFFQKHGRQLEAGYCFSKEECSNWYACWDCSNFIMTKNEINEAIKILSIQMVELKSMKKCIDFSFDAPSVKRKFNLISCIIKRLEELNLTQEDITKMVDNCLNNKDITSGVIN